MFQKRVHFDQKYVMLLHQEVTFVHIIIANSCYSTTYKRVDFSLLDSELLFFYTGRRETKVLLEGFCKVRLAAESDHIGYFCYIIIAFFQ